MTRFDSISICEPHPPNNLELQRQAAGVHVVLYPNVNWYTHLRQPHSTPGFAKLFPSLGGSGVLLWLHSIPFVCVCLLLQMYLIVFKALFTTQHRHRSVVYPATRRSTVFTPVIKAYNMLVDIPVYEARNGLSAQYQ